MKFVMIWLLLPIVIPLMLIAWIGDIADDLYWRLRNWVHHLR